MVLCGLSGKGADRHGMCGQQCGGRMTGAQPGEERRTRYAELGRRACALIVSLAFMIAAWGKLADPLAMTQALWAAGVPGEIARYLPSLVPPLEIACGIGLLFFVRSRLVYVVSALLLVSFSVFLVILHRVDPSASCGCFGSRIEALTGGGLIPGIIRNLVLIALLLWPAWHYLRGRARTGVSWTGEAAGAERCA